MGFGANRYLRSSCILVLLSVSCADSGSLSPSSATSGPDPLFDQEWHLSNSGQSTFSTGVATIGNDINYQTTVSQGYSGAGVHVLLSDDGMEIDHEDLAANYDASRSRDYSQPAPYTGSGAHKNLFDMHGTAVAGIIAAVGNNAIGVKGVAPGVSISSANVVSSSVSVNTAILVDQADTTAEIVNQSWGSTQNFINPISPTYLAQIASAVSTKRSGKGTIFVQSAGNNYRVSVGGGLYQVGNSNFDGLKSTPYSLVVGALDSSDNSTATSSTGSNLWLSAYGGGDGVTTPAILTTDRSGCENGISISISTKNTFESGSNPLNTNCNYTSVMNGTSSAAAMVSGATALMLEANPNLSWRDVRHIYATTSVKVNPSIGNVENPNVASPSGHVWQQGWVENAAHYSFHNRFGFGKLDVDATVAMAKAYSLNLGTLQTSSATSGVISIAVPEDSVGTSTNLNDATGLTVESVQVKVSITHPNVGEIGLELTSPSNTKSIVKNINDSLSGVANLSDAVFTSNAFYGESSSGNWTLKVLDGATGNTGTLTNWTITVYGH
jgi:subtilisin-like proprotein convertase family protein